jgi:hypothetical protein
MFANKTIAVAVPMVPEIRLELQPVAGPRASAASLHGLLSPRGFAFSIVAIWVYFLVPRPLEDPDIWWHLRDAAAQIQAHAFLHRDAFSFTAAGATWINHEWLAELPFYLGWHLAGATGIYLVTLLTIEAIFLGVFLLAERKSGNLTAALLTTLVACLLATVSFGPRTLLFGWVLLVIELFILEAFPAHPRAIYALPPLFALWVNAHGSWLIGLVVLAVFLLCGVRPLRWGAVQSPGWSPAQSRTLGTVLLLCACALFLNPYGWHLVLYPFDLAFHQKLNIANVAEWQPVNFQTARGLVLLIALGALLLAQLIPAPTRRTWTLYELALVSIGTYSAVVHARFLFLAAILIMPVLARQLGGHTTQRLLLNIPRINAAFLVAMLLLVATRTAHSTSVASPQEEQFPVAALPFLKSFQPHGHVFNEFLWGGYLGYQAPQIPVFIDSRVDIFEYNGVLRDYLDTIRLKGSLAVLDKYQIRYVFFEKDTPLVYLLQQTGRWKPDYDDGKVVLLERSNGPAQPVAQPRAATR